MNTLHNIFGPGHWTESLPPINPYPIHTAVIFNQTSDLERLLKVKHDLEQQDQDGLTALDLAIQHGHTECVQILLAQWKYIGEAHIRKAMIDPHANLVASQMQETTQRLHKTSALSSFQQAVLEGRLEKSNNFDARERTLEGHTLLHLAVMSGSYDTVCTILEHMTGVDDKSNDGLTPLHYAALTKDKRIFKRLMEKDAFIWAGDRFGVTPIALLAAEAKSRDPLALSFLEKGLFTLALFSLSLRIPGALPLLGLSSGILPVIDLALACGVFAATQKALANLKRVNPYNSSRPWKALQNGLVHLTTVSALALSCTKLSLAIFSGRP